MRILSFSYLLDIGMIVQAFQKITELKKRGSCYSLSARVIIT